MYISSHLEAEVGEIIGNVFIGGEMMSCLRTSLVTTNSSKSNRIFLLLNFTAPEEGVVWRSTGGVVSFGPPVGEPRRAHCQRDNERSNRVIIRGILYFIGKLANKQISK